MKAKAKRKPKKDLKYRYHYLMRMPMTEAVTEIEGGPWIPFHEFSGRLVHSIRFVGGHEWDAVNGWRNTEFSSTGGRGLTCSTAALREPPASWKKVDKMPRGYPEPASLSAAAHTHDRSLSLFEYLMTETPEEAVARTRRDPAAPGYMPAYRYYGAHVVDWKIHKGIV